MEYAEYWSKVAGIPSGYKLNSKCNNKVSKFAIDPTPQEISIWEKIGELLEESSRCMIKCAKIQTMSSSIRIINSAGFDCEYASRFAYLNCLLDIHNKLYSYNAIAHNIEELLQIFMCAPLIALRIKCKQELCLYPTGEYTVVLSSVALSNIISAFTGIFIGKDAQKREQLLAELRLDAGLLSICDNGLCPDGYAFAGRAAE